MNHLGVWAFLLIGALLLAGPGVGGQEDDGGALLLILDASGSMNALDDNGMSLIDGAQNALVRLVEGLPEGIPVGLRVYGHRVPNTDRANGCQDSELVMPVGPLEPQAMIEAIRGFQARGFTPIGLSLQSAASDLPGGRGTVILVSDGEDTCSPPDPCEVAAELIAGGIDVRVHTVGFFLKDDDPARAQLQCIAETTGASYRDVDAIETLTTELGMIIRESIPGLGNFALPFQGSPAMLDAPLLPLVVQATEVPGPPLSAFGAFVGSLEPGQTLWYSIELDAPSQVIAWGDAWPFVDGAAADDTLEVTIADQAGSPVHLWDSRFGRSRVETFNVTSNAQLNLGVNVQIGFDGPWDGLELMLQETMASMGYDRALYDAAVRELLTRPEPPRIGPGTYYIGYTWSTDENRLPRPFEFGITTWPITDSIHLQYSVVTGGIDADGSALLTPAGYARGPIQAWPTDGYRQGGYLTDIARGSTLWYRTHLEWDEALSVRAFLNREEGTSASSGESFRVEIFDPTGETVGEPFDGRSPEANLDNEAVLDRSFLPRGLAPRPLIGAATQWLVDGKTPTVQGSHLIAFTWDGAEDGATAQVEFVVNVHGNLGIPESASLVPTDNTQAVGLEEEVEAAPDDQSEPDSGSRDLFITVGIVTVLIAAAATFWRRRRAREN